MMRARLAILAALLALPSAEAQMKKWPTPAGNWGFQTEPMGAGCVLSGSMSVTQTKDKAFKCSFKASWSCQMRMPRLVETEQSCIATQSGPDVVITSKIDKIGKVDPAELVDYMRRAYAADHFKVAINGNGDEMTGMFQSYGSAPVRFRRKLDLIG